MANLGALPAVLLLYSLSALAWGGLGHEAMCELAFRELDETARQRVIALIQQDPEFITFRASCNWADRPRQRASEHFVNLPRDATGLDDDECPLAEECVVSAIEHDFRYCVMVDGTCQYAVDNREFDEGEPERVVVVDDRYLDRHAAVARKRIAMAGVRLAGLINRAG